MKRILIALSALVFMFSLNNANPWPMFRNDAQHTGCAAYNGPLFPVLHWSYETGAGVKSSPATYYGTICVGSEDNNFYSFNSDGNIAWSYQTGAAVSSSPAISEGNMAYVGSNDGNLYAFSLSTSGSVHQLIWSYEAAEAISSSPVIDSAGKVFVGSCDNRLYGLNSDGTLTWSYETAGDANSSPAIGTDTVYVGSDDNCLYAVGSTGALSWSYETGDDISSSPAMNYGYDEIYIGSNDNRLYGVSSIGSLFWSYETAEDVRSSLGFENIDYTPGYVGSDDNNLYCFSLSTSGTVDQLNWSYQTGDDVSSSPAIDANSNVYVGSDDNRIYVFGANGAFLWSYVAGSGISSSPAIGNEDWTLYVGSNDNKILALQCTPTPTLSPTSTPIPTAACTWTPTVTPSATPTPSATLEPTATQTPTPTTTPLLDVTLSGSSPGVGDGFTVNVSVQPCNRTFDAWGVILAPGGVIYSFVLGKPGELYKGLKPLAVNVPRLLAPCERTLFAIPRIPAGSSGNYMVIVGFIRTGKPPSVANAIPGFIDQESLSVP